MEAMLRQIAKVCFKDKCLFKTHTRTLCLSLHYSKEKKSIVTEVKDYELPENDAHQRVRHCISRDMKLLKRYLTLQKKNPAISDDGRVIDWDNPYAPIFPNYVDIVVIGGGLVGSSVAYWLKKKGKEDMRVVVIEKDPSYKFSSSLLPIGALRHQFSLEENIEMSLFGSEFLRNIDDYLGIHDKPPINVNYHPCGYLTLATEENAEAIMANSRMQNSLGAKNVVLSKEQLHSKFPWLNTTGIELGCLGVENEGWFDPWMLLHAFRNKNLSMEVEYIAADAKGFHFKIDPEAAISGSDDAVEELDYLVVETEDGKLRPVHFSKCVICAGAFSADMAAKGKIGLGPGMLAIPLPLEPRKRYVYCVHAPNGPGLNTPMLIDPTSAYFRREGLANHYICGMTPTFEEEPDFENLDVDNEFFEHKVKPIISKRINGLDKMELKSSWAGYYQYNTFDENGIIGVHPYHDNLYFATGFTSPLGAQQAPAVGRAMMELLTHGRAKTLNLSRLGFDRFVTKK